LLAGWSCFTRGSVRVAEWHRESRKRDSVLQLQLWSSFSTPAALTWLFSLEILALAFTPEDTTGCSRVRRRRMPRQPQYPGSRSRSASARVVAPPISSQCSTVVRLTPAARRRRTILESGRRLCAARWLQRVLGSSWVQAGFIVNTSPGTSFTPGGCLGWKRMCWTSGVSSYVTSRAGTGRWPSSASGIAWRARRGTNGSPAIGSAARGGSRTTAGLRWRAHTGRAGSSKPSLLSHDGSMGGAPRSCCTSFERSTPIACGQPGVR